MISLLLRRHFSKCFLHRLLFDLPFERFKSPMLLYVLHSSYYCTYYFLQHCNLRACV